jgi:DNA uptake protein ComE-like DNA-binding protein
MISRNSFTLTAVAMLLSASLVMAQGSTPAKSGTRAVSAKPAAAAGVKPAAAANVKPAAVPVAAAQAKPAAAAALVDLNSATKADLMKLPGIGEAISAKIIAGRPWANKAQLLSKGLVSKPVYDKLSALVVAKQAK